MAQSTNSIHTIRMLAYFFHLLKFSQKLTSCDSKLSTYITSIAGHRSATTKLADDDELGTDKQQVLSTALAD